MSIEHEDALASVDEGLRAAVDLLSRVILTEPPVDAWWHRNRDWGHGDLGTG